MAWRMIEVPDGERDDDLTSSELVAVSIMMAQGMGEPHNDMNVYYRAWQKLQPQVNQAPGNAALRDEFAMRAMQTMLEQVYDYEEATEVQLARFRLMAKDAYQMADIMLVVRNGGDQGGTSHD